MSSFIVDAACLTEALAALNTIVPTKPSRDILKCVKIVAKNGVGGQVDSIVLYATDLETFAVVSVNQSVMVHKAGEFVVPAVPFLEYVRTFDTATVNIAVTSDNTMKVNEDGAEFEVGTQDLDEFPDFPSVPSEQETWIPIGLTPFSDSLKKVLFAVADKGHPRWGALSAVAIECSANKVALIGTDQHRASVAEMDSVTGLVDKQYLVSGKALGIIPKVFNTDFYLHVEDKNSLIFKAGSSYLFFRLMHGSFPPVRKFVPQHKSKLQFNPGVLLKQAKRIALAVDEHESMKIILKDSKLTLMSKTRQQRKVAKVEQDISYTGPDLQFALNCKYLLDLLKAADQEQDIEFCFNQNNQPIVFKQPKFDHVMVPLEVR